MAPVVPAFEPSHLNVSMDEVLQKCVEIGRDTLQEYASRLKESGVFFARQFIERSEGVKGIKGFHHSKIKKVLTIATNIVC